jgi:hypothetical protein
MGDDFLGNALTQQPIYAGGDFHVRDAQYLAVLIHDRLNIGREMGLVRQRSRVGVHLSTLRGREHGVTGTSFLVLWPESEYFGPVKWSGG